MAPACRAEDRVHDLTPAPGLRLNEHIEADGQTVFAHACKMGLEGIVSKRKDLALPQRPLARLGQEQEPGLRGGAARGGGELGAGVADALRSASIRGAGLNLALARFIYAWANHPSLSILLRREFQAGQHDHTARSSSALVMRRQSPANLSRQMATGFGCDGCRVGTVVGIRSVRG